MNSPLDHLRGEVEAMLAARGFQVLDIVTHDVSDDGDTEWIVGAHHVYLALSNNFGPLLLGTETDRARRIIKQEIERLAKRLGMP
jgi:hypothetical protein